MAEEILELSPLLEITADNIGEPYIVNGVFHCVFYALQPIHGGTLAKVAVGRLNMPVASVPAAAARAVAAVNLTAITDAHEFIAAEPANKLAN